VTPTIFGSTVGYPSDSLASCFVLSCKTSAHVYILYRIRIICNTNFLPSGITHYPGDFVLSSEQYTDFLIALVVQYFLYFFIFTFFVVYFVYYLIFRKQITSLAGTSVCDLCCCSRSV